MYKKLTGEDTVHTAFYPEADEALIDEHVEERMDLVRSLVTLGRGAREKERIKVRQPLAEVLVDGKYESLIADMTDLIKEELNVKEVVFEKDLDQYMNFTLKPNFKAAGPVLGSKVKAFGGALAKMDAKEVVQKLEGEGQMTLELNGEETVITKDLVDTRISAKEGFAVSMENNLFTILDTNLTPELVDEGLSREFISKVQQMRKAADFEMMDRIKITYAADADVAKAVAAHKDHIMSETLAVEMNEGEGGEVFKLNGHETAIKVERV